MSSQIVFAYNAPKAINGKLDSSEVLGSTLNRASLKLGNGFAHILNLNPFANQKECPISIEANFPRVMMIELVEIQQVGLVPNVANVAA